MVQASKESTSEIVAISMLNQNPDPAKAGSTVELRFKVENLGAKNAENLIIELKPKYPFDKISGEEYVQKISTLSGYQQGNNAAIVKYKVKIDQNAKEETSYLTLDYKTDKQSYVAKSFGVDISGEEFAQIIYINKAQITPGKQTELNFTVTNIGNTPLQNLVFSWEEAQGVVLPVYSDDTKYIKNLNVGESSVLHYKVVADVNANPGLYRLDLTLKFETKDGVSKETKTKAGIFVGGETDFEVTFSESSEGKTSLSVANVGSNPALSVTVKIPQQQGYRVIGSTNSIIGNLDKGDYTIVSFQISPTSLTGGEIKSNKKDSKKQALTKRTTVESWKNKPKALEINIEYTDTTGARKILKKSVPIQFRSVSSSNTNFGNRMQFKKQQTPGFNYKILIAVFVLLAIVGGIIYYKKKVEARYYLNKFWKIVKDKK